MQCFGREDCSCPMNPFVCLHAPVDLLENKRSIGCECIRLPQLLPA
jgi:hypothetical protein